MKKLTIICTALALLAMVSSCKKDQETVNLGVAIEQSSKLYIDDHMPSWNAGDQVYVNDNAYAISNPVGGSGQLNNVTAASGYRAIYPASLIAEGTDISSTSTIPVTLPATQLYTVVNNHQRCELPMGAYLTSGSTLLFHNLCSVVRVTVNNQLNDALAITGITIAAQNAYLSGAGTATIAGQSDDAIVMASTGSHEVTLAKSDNSAMETLPVSTGTATFDIVVPAFSTADNVVITVSTAEGYQEFTKANVTLTNSTVTTVTANVNSLTPYQYANLVDGPTFSAAIPTTATAVRFEYNNTSVTSGTLLSTATSPISIYGNLASDGTWVVSTAASIIYAHANCSNMFVGTWSSSTGTSVSNLTSIDFGSGFRTDSVTNMSQMFLFCRNLTSLNLSNFNTSSVTNMEGMFSSCYGLTSLNLSNFNTSSVTNMRSMFSYCSGLTSLNVSNFNTSSVTNMSYMFASCSGLTSLNVSNFNTSSVTNMGYMFCDCLSLTSLDVSNFNTSSVTNMECMFMFCSSLTSLNLSNFNTSSVTDMSSMFYYCYGLTSLNLSNFNTSSVTNMASMFSYCYGLTSLNLSNFNTSSVTNMGGMFSYCYGLTSLDLSNFNTSSVTNMEYMFYYCNGLTSLDLSNFNTSSVTNMSFMFGLCNSLTSLNLYNFNMGSVTSKSYMCYHLATSSHACTITCPTAVRTALESGTNLPTSGVTFTWSTH